MPEFPKLIVASADDAGVRLDQLLVAKLPEVSRARIQQLISENKVKVNGAHPKASLRLRGGEQIELTGEVQSPSLRAIAEAIPLEIVCEDDDLAIINKPAGMMVHAGAGTTESARNRGTLVNALLHHFKNLSQLGGELRPGIVHRLDRETSGLLVVAKNDESHRRLAAQFAGRTVKKQYVALVHGWIRKDSDAIRGCIRRDRVHRTRMTTRGVGGRLAVTHYLVRQRLDTVFGKFSLLDVKIETGRTHQIRVHLSSLGHPVVGDTLYGAPQKLHPKPLGGNKHSSSKHSAEPSSLSLGRNFLHAASLELKHPRSGKDLSFNQPIPAELEEFLKRLQVP